MKTFVIILTLAVSALVISSAFSETKSDQAQGCTYNKDSMIVVMKIERKVKPEHVSLLKRSFDACRKEVLAKEPGCLDYSMYQSYNDSTIFCITEAWINKGAHNAHMELDHTKKHIAEIRGINDPAYKSTTNYTYWICPGANQKK